MSFILIELELFGMKEDKSLVPPLIGNLHIQNLIPTEDPEEGEENPNKASDPNDFSGGKNSFLIPK